MNLQIDIDESGETTRSGLKSVPHGGASSHVLLMEYRAQTMMGMVFKILPDYFSRSIPACVVDQDNFISERRFIESLQNFIEVIFQMTFFLVTRDNEAQIRRFDFRFR
ncbi:hypothetical protein A3J34_01175 [Candidatus Peribacteria bacterium RIFCSPLOWO2_02_FULL_51_10]|nr:MAG: hypothetical protein A3J34_01175 [Candidatus Peribacteria bacterium RIFCSPLOWO2_02_FULL_51_10]